MAIYSGVTRPLPQALGTTDSPTFAGVSVGAGTVTAGAVDNASGTLDLYASSVKCVSIRNNKSVGIGVGVPLEDLHIYSTSQPTILVERYSTSAGAPMLMLKKSDTGLGANEEVGIVHGTGYDSIGGSTNYGSIYFNCESNTAGDTCGSVEVKARVSASHRTLISATGSGGQAAVRVNEDNIDCDFIVETQSHADALSINGVSGILTLGAVYSHDMNGETLRDLQINSSGELGYDSSTIRSKVNVADITDKDTAILRQLRPVTYNPALNSPFGRMDHPVALKRYGLIAEEVEAIAPEFVYHGDDGSPDGVNYKEFIPLLIGEVQRLNNRISELEAICLTQK